MENLQLIVVTILITLFSGTLVGSLIYLGVVVRKLKRTIRENVVDISNLQSEVRTLHVRMDSEVTAITNNLGSVYSELDSKINSRYDKLLDKISGDLHQNRVDMEHLREIIRTRLERVSQYNVKSVNSEE